MSRASIRRFPVLLPTLAIFLLSTATPAVADDEEIRRQMLGLADQDSSVRQGAIEALGRTRDRRLAKFFEAYQRGSVFLWNDKVVLCEKMAVDTDGKRIAPLADPLTGQPLLADGKQLVVDAGELRELSPSRRERRLLANMIRLLRDLSSPNPEERLAAVRRFGDSRNSQFLAPLEEVVGSEPDKKVRRAAREGILIIRVSGNVSGQKQEERLAAARALGEMHSARGLVVLQDLLRDSSLDPVTRGACQRSIARIERYQSFVHGFQYLFTGLSLGSVLILMALGLSIIFGQMGVINLAHGELMMIGAYATYEMQLLFGHSLPDNPANWYFVVALPVAFLSAALVGYLIELLVVRHLYGRPLETLLATWGVGLVLIQAVRVRYGDNIGVNSPTWLVGGTEIMQDFIVPYSRCFIIVLCAACVLLVYWQLNFTRLGLLLRATVQNRETADSLGVNTRRMDGFTFALGAGLAGIAGCALTLIGGVTPDMGQNYIVDSFLVVVTGGVGELAGVVWAGLGIGVLNKFLEPTFAAIWAKVLILFCVIVFIQWRPAGLFPPKGRLADV